MQARRTRRRTAVAVALLGGLMALAACGGSSDKAAPVAKDGAASGKPTNYIPLTLADGAQTVSAFNAPYAVYAPDHAWKTREVPVTLQLTQGGTQSAQLVASGQAQVSIVGLSSALTVAAKSPDLKIIAVTGGNIWHLAVPTNSPVKTLSELKGKTIGVQALNTGMYLYNRAALKIEGLNPDKDVTWLPIGTGAQAADAINSGKVAAIATYDGPFEVLNGLTKGGLRLLPSPLDQLDGSGAWIANAKVLREHRDEIVSFLAGLGETAKLAQSNPQDILSYLWQKNPETKPRNMSDQAAMASQTALVKAYWSKVLNKGPEGSYGVLSDAALKKAVDFHADNGIVEGKVDISKSVDLSVARDAAKS